MEPASPDFVDTTQPTEDAPAKKRSPNGFRKMYLLIRQKWPEYVVEIGVIILGITLSFAVDEWKDQREKRELEQVYLKSLLSDVKEDANDLNETMAETREIVDKAQQLLAVADPSGGYSIDRVQFVKDIKFLAKRPNFIANDATFSDLKGSGHLHLLSDFTLKNALFQYYKRYEAIHAVETAERDAVIAITGPYLIRHIGLVRTDSTAISQSGIETILRDHEFSNQIYLRLSNRQELLEKYTQIRSLNQNIKLRLEKQIR